MPRLIRTVARTAVVAGTATAVSNRVSRRQDSHWSAQEQSPQELAPPAAPPAQVDDYDARLAQLKELGALHDQGILNDVEFETQKRRLLEP